MFLTAHSQWSNFSRKRQGEAWEGHAEQSFRKRRYASTRTSGRHAEGFVALTGRNWHFSCLAVSSGDWGYGHDEAQEQQARHRLIVGRRTKPVVGYIPVNIALSSRTGNQQN